MTPDWIPAKDLEKVARALFDDRHVFNAQCVFDIDLTDEEIKMVTRWMNDIVSDAIANI